MKKEDFENRLFKHFTRIIELKDIIFGEEATKQSLITPFLTLLGYDVSDPRQVRMEYLIDGFRDKKTKDKVDYAVLDGQNPVFFIEAKAISEPLDGHGLQLSRYFNFSPTVRFAILTNGLHYQFFTDNTFVNIMDETPFYELDIENCSQLDIDFLLRFVKDRLDVKKLKYVSRVVNQVGSENVLRQVPISYGRPKVLDVKRLTVTIDSPTFSRFNAYVNRYGINRSKILRELITHWLEETISSKGL